MRGRHTAEQTSVNRGTAYARTRGPLSHAVITPPHPPDPVSLELTHAGLAAWPHTPGWTEPLPKPPSLIEGSFRLCSGTSHSPLEGT